MHTLYPVRILKGPFLSSLDTKEVELWNLLEKELLL